MDRPLGREEVRPLFEDLLRRPSVTAIEVRKLTGFYVIAWEVGGQRVAADSVSSYIEKLRVTFSDNYDDDQMINPWQLPPKPKPPEPKPI